ncbi:hypothetical protein BCD48_40605 [Pseudofrankia sp. BMG5.36]|nr:hypothetical protein BCD48_40605 [Pseudofrankia sp. BMG5.36]
MRAAIGEPITVGRPTAEEPALDARLGLHGRAHADLDALALALGHPAEDGHDQVVGFAVRVDRSADLGYPQGDVVVGEHGEDQAELVAVERPVRLSDDNRIEAPPRVA